MKVIYRRVLKFSAIVVFLATAPLIVFYAMGYRISPQSIDPLPVGVLLVESTPRRAEVIVNEKIVGTTPASLSNLHPGKVKVTVRMPGYSEWRKELPIEPTAVTEARAVRLFPVQPNIKVLMPSVLQFSVSPNRHIVGVVTTDQRLHFIDDTGIEITNAITLKRPIKELFWSPDSNNVLLKGQYAMEFIQLSRIRDGVQTLPSSLQNAQDVRWDPRIPGRLLILDSKNILAAYNIDTKQPESLIAGVETFATSSRYIYGVGNSILARYDLQGQIIRTFPIKFDKPVIKLHITPADRIAVQFLDNSIAIVNEQDEQEKITDSAYTVGWSPDGELLLLQLEPTALYIYNAGDERLQHIKINELKLIVRLSRPIRLPQWFAGGQHVIYQSDDEIMITEIDTRDHPLTHTVDTTNLGDASVAVGRDGELLLYLKRKDNITDLVAASLL